MIELSFDEAMARLSDMDPMEVHIETIPNNGLTHVQKMNRMDCIARLRNNNVFEAGIVAQRRDLGLYVNCIGSPTGDIRDTRILRVFFPTKPECRLNEEQLAESVKRSGGASIHSATEVSE